MLNAIATLLGLKHSLVTGLAIAALLLVFGPQLKKMGTTEPQQVQQAQKGLYIIDGKKVMVK